MGRYWKVVIKEGDVDVTGWVDDEIKEPFCIVKHETEGITTKTTKYPPISEQTEGETTPQPLQNKSFEEELLKKNPDSFQPNRESVSATR